MINVHLVPWRTGRIFNYLGYFKIRIISMGAFVSASDRLSGFSGISSRNTFVSSPIYKSGSASRRSSSFSFSTKPIIFCRSFLISCFPAASNSRQASLHKFSTSASFTSMKRDSDKNNGFREILSAPALSSPSSMEKNKEIVLSGIRPTGFLHLGNYFGALKNWARMQYEYECYFFIADWHSLTTHADTSELVTDYPTPGIRINCRRTGSGKMYHLCPE